MLKSLKLLLAIAIFATLQSCKKSSSDTVTFKATLSGQNEVPANMSTASGESVLTYNKSTKMFTIVTIYNGLTPVMGHIHKAVEGTNGPVIFPFPDVSKSPITVESAMTDAQYDALLKDSMYVNLHTAAFPAGEIRGQLRKQ